MALPNSTTIAASPSSMPQRQVRLPILCSSGGAYTVNTGPLWGYLHSIQVLVATPYNLATGADWTVDVLTDNSTTVLNALTITNSGTADVLFMPRFSTNKSTDASATGGFERVLFTGQAIKLTISSGGNATTGLCILQLSDY